jgi:glycosyltransferase involved in cell wall biosynthesis
MPFFSVVIPLYNKAPHVAETIASALAQTLPPHEIIVIDDASTDEGPAIVRALDDPLIRMIGRTTPGPGGYAARNAGIEAATGDWIAFLDADDSWQPDHLRNLAAAIDTAPEPVGGAFSGVWIAEGEGRRPYPYASRHIRPGVALGLADVVRGWLASRDCPLWTGGVAFRRDVLLAAGLFPAGLAKRGGDKDLWVRAAFRTRLAFAPERTANFHQDTSNRVSNFTAHTELPILTRTIAALMPQANATLRPLLRQLANREIGRYARRNTKAGVAIPLSFFRALYLPGGLDKLVYLIGLSAIRPFVSRR